MSGTLALLRGRGADGLPPPEAPDLAAWAPPPSPNHWRAGPDAAGPRATALAPFPLPPDILFALVRAVAARQPRTTPHGLWPERRRAQWVVRSAVANFPDLVSAEVTEAPGGAALRLLSRSLLGWSDLGANRRRVEAWLAALAAEAGTPPGR